MEITKEKFSAYEKVRQSGQTNMYAVDKVIALALEDEDTELTKEEIKEIMRNYSKYKDKYSHKYCNCGNKLVTEIEQETSFCRECI